MKSHNQADVLGNLTHDPMEKTLKNGEIMCQFSVATNRKWTDSNGQLKEETEYHNIVAFGKLAEICCKTLAKSSKVYVQGRMQTRSWDNQPCGMRHQKMEIVANEVIVLTPWPEEKEREYSNVTF